MRLQERTAAEWMAIFRANGNVAAEQFLTTTEALDHPDLVGNGDIVTLDDPVHGPVRTIGPIAELDGDPGGHRPPGAASPAPHTAEVLGRAGRATPIAGRRRRPCRRAPTGGRPLDGITVVEFATIIAAPLATSMLADLGARVIKVELIDGDPYRHLVAGGTPAAKTTAGKSSICIDLKQDEGRRIAQRARRARPTSSCTTPAPACPTGSASARRSCAADNPELIWVSLTGYGRAQPGRRPAGDAPVRRRGHGRRRVPGRRRASTAPCATLADVREISRQLMRANESNPDPSTAVVVAEAVVLALLARERFGVGQAVYVNMLDGQHVRQRRRRRSTTPASRRARRPTTS